MKDKISKPEEEWKRELGPERYAVTRQKATERAFTGEYDNCKEKGTYRCVCCGAELFSSDTKFESGSGWPSFWKPLDEQADILAGQHGPVVLGVPGELGQRLAGRRVPERQLAVVVGGRDVDHDLGQTTVVCHPASVRSAG